MPDPEYAGSGRATTSIEREVGDSNHHRIAYVLPFKRHGNTRRARQITGVRGSDDTTGRVVEYKRIGVARQPLHTVPSPRVGLCGKKYMDRSVYAVETDKEQTRM